MTLLKESSCKNSAINGDITISETPSELSIASLKVKPAQNENYTFEIKIKNSSNNQKSFDEGSYVHIAGIDDKGNITPSSEWLHFSGTVQPGKRHYSFFHDTPGNPAPIV